MTRTRRVFLLNQGETDGCGVVMPLFVWVRLFALGGPN